MAYVEPLARKQRSIRSFFKDRIFKAEKIAAAINTAAAKHMHVYQIAQHPEKRVTVAAIFSPRPSMRPWEKPIPSANAPLPHRPSPDGVYHGIRASIDIFCQYIICLGVCQALNVSVIIFGTRLRISAEPCRFLPKRRGRYQKMPLASQHSICNHHQGSFHSIPPLTS